MVDVGEGSNKSSNDIKSEAFTEPWSEKDYSSDPDYSGDAMSNAVEAFEYFPVYEKELVADGGEDYSELSSVYSEEAGEVLGEFFGEEVAEDLEPDRDPRVEEAENSEFSIDMSGPAR